MMERVGPDEGQVPLVLACVAYSLYKNEKRQWITDWQAENGRKPFEEEVDYFVSTWNDLRIESTFVAARDEIGSFVEGVVEASKEDLSGEVYQALFRSLSDKIEDNRRASDNRAATISTLIEAKTKKTHWFFAGCADIIVSIFANFAWLGITILVLLGAYLTFDPAGFAEKAGKLFGKESPAQSDKENLPQGVKPKDKPRSTDKPKKQT